MSKFRSLKKKLLAALCAFASGVSGVSAKLGDRVGRYLYLDVNLENFIGYVNYGGALGVDGYSDLEKWLLEFDGPDCKFEYGEGGKRFGIAVHSVKEAGMICFSLRHCIFGDGGDVRSLLSFCVPVGFVAERLWGADDSRLLTKQSIGWYSFVELSKLEEKGKIKREEACSVFEIRLLEIFFRDILGYDYKFYDVAKGYVDKDATISSIGDDNHPGFGGCMSLLSDELHKDGGVFGKGVLRFSEFKYYMSGGGFDFDEPEIWRRLTANIDKCNGGRGSLYYQKYHVGLDNWLKAGMGVLGIGAAGGIGYALFDNLIRRPKENEEYSGMKQRLLQLGALEQWLEQEREILDRYRKFTSGKPVYKDLIKKSEGKEALKKAKGNGASKGKTRQIKKASKGSRRRSRG